MKEKNLTVLQKVGKCVVKTITFLHTYGYSDANIINIWTVDIYNFQLKVRLEEYFSEDDAISIIKIFHTEIIKNNPELKEY